MPIIGNEKTITPIKGVGYIKLFPHPLDLKALADNGGVLPEEYVPNSVFSTCYGEFESQTAYEATPAGQFPEMRNPSGNFGCSGEAVRAIVNLIGFHALCSVNIAGLLNGSITEDTFGVEGARERMAGLEADLGFGTKPFTVEAPGE